MVCVDALNWRAVAILLASFLSKKDKNHAINGDAMETTARKILVLALVAWMPIDSLYAASEEWISPQGEYFFQSEKASLEELDHARGREGIDVTTLNRMNVRGFVKDNSAINNTSGYNFIDNGSFVGASGMFSVIQNSGNNVLIQDSTILNITILP